MQFNKDIVWKPFLPPILLVKLIKKSLMKIHTVYSTSCGISNLDFLFSSTLRFLKTLSATEKIFSYGILKKARHFNILYIYIYIYCIYISISTYNIFYFSRIIWSKFKTFHPIKNLCSLYHVHHEYSLNSNSTNIFFYIT